MTFNAARPWRTYMGCAGLVLVSLLIMLPYVAAHTGLRHWIVTRSLGNPRLAAHVGTASFGWFTPLKLSQLTITDNQQALHVNVDEVATNNSWVRIAWDLPDVGRVVLQRPVLDLVADGGWQPLDDRQDSRDKPEVVAVVKNAQLLLRPTADAEPVVNLDGLDLIVHVQRSDEGHTLRVEPVQLLDHQPLTREMMHRGMRLITPVLAQATHMEGSVSFHVDEFHIPLELESDADSLRQTSVAGRLEFHDLSAGLKDPVLLTVSQSVAQILGRDVPTRMRIVQNTEINFHCAEGRVYHDGMAFVLPELSDELVIVTSGSVGLDETLDLTVEIPLPLDELHDGPLIRKISQRPLRLQVTGTLDNPVMGLLPQDRWLANLADDVLDEAVLGESAAALQELIDGAGQILPLRTNGEGPLGGIMKRLGRRGEPWRQQLEAEPNTVGQSAAPEREGATDAPADAQRGADEHENGESIWERRPLRRLFQRQGRRLQPSQPDQPDQPDN